MMKMIKSTKKYFRKGRIRKKKKKIRKRRMIQIRKKLRVSFQLLSKIWISLSRKENLSAL